MGACRRCSGHPPAPALADHAGPLAAQYHFDEKITNDAGDSTPDSSGHAFGAFTTRIAALAESPTLKRASWLNGSSSSAASGRTITKYEWDFNADGVYDAQCGADAPAVSRPFSKSGAVKVALRVTDTAGARSPMSDWS